jgi:FkbM family methyltransferase
MGIVRDVGKKLMLTESEWNPKVIVGRAMTFALPTGILNFMMKRYYALVLAKAPADWGETDKAAVEQLIREDDEVVDVGASIGAYTKFLAAKAQRVYSFEPNPQVFDFLVYNIKKLRLSNVQTFACALSDSERTDTMIIPRYRWGSECHYDATLDSRQQKPGLRSVEVEVSTLDSVLGGNNVSFVKCDVNGHELAFLRGALETIRRCRPAILLELLGNPDRVGSAAQKVFSLLGEEGYSAYVSEGKFLRQREPGRRSQNYFFLPTPLPERLIGRPNFV